MDSKENYFNLTISEFLRNLEMGGLKKPAVDAAIISNTSKLLLAIMRQMKEDMVQQRLREAVLVKPTKVEVSKLRETMSEKWSLEARQLAEARALIKEAIDLTADLTELINSHNSNDSNDSQTSQSDVPTTNYNNFNNNNSNNFNDSQTSQSDVPTTNYNNFNNSNNSKN